MRDILTTLKAEHDELRSLFEQVNATTDRAEKTRRFRKVSGDYRRKPLNRRRRRFFAYFWFVLDRANP